MKKTAIKMTASALIVFILAACGWAGASQAPSCGDEEVTSLVLSEVFKQAGLREDGDKVMFMFNEIPGGVTGDIEYVRERDYRSDIKKRYCTGESSVEFGNGEVPLALQFALGGANGTVNYSVQITEDGSTFVMVGE